MASYNRRFVWTTKGGYGPGVEYGPGVDGAGGTLTANAGRSLTANQVGWGPQLIRGSDRVVLQAPQDVRTEIERVLSERADDWERLRPFALKCPECSAPVESGKTECKYCKVPLVWEPKESLSRDDHWMRIASARASQPPPSSSTNGWLSFGPTTILAMSKKTFKWRPQVPLRPYRLVLIGDLDRFHVTSIRKGPTEILAMGYAPARAFGPTEVSPAVFQDYTIYVAETFAITIENVTPANQNISGYVETRSLGDPPPRQAAVEEEDSP